MSCDISVIIVNYNAGRYLGLCVESILLSDAVAEIIVVDNASTDNSLASLPESKYLCVIKNPVNVGFASGCNVGIQSATSDTLLFLNPDCAAQPEALSTMLSALYSDPAIGMVGGFLSNMDGTEQAGGRRAIPTPWRSFVRAFGLSRFSGRWPRLFFDFHLHNQPLPTRPIELEAISGACMMVKREAMSDVGEWDEGYFLHCEDLDLCMRFRQNGWKILFVPAAHITHALGVCGRSRPIFVEWHKHRGMMRFYYKFFRHHYPGLLMGLVAVGVWLRFSLVASSCLLTQLRRSLRFHRA
jgi:GT2 family glycosyltransferase